MGKSELDFSYYSPACTHELTLVQAGRFIVFCSSYHVQPHDVDISILLDRRYQNQAIVTTNGCAAWRFVNHHRQIFVDWQDFNTIPVEILVKLIDYIRSKLKKYSIEIACVGGHGRTGTLLACLIARVEHLDYQTAIRETRRRYCALAIETASQIQLIKEYCQKYVGGKRKWKVTE